MNNIKAIIKKELRSYFDHPLGYILLAVFLGLSNFFFFKAVFLSKEASLRPLFEMMPWFLLFLVPAVTMKAIAAEHKEGTVEIVLAQPISEIEFIIGKFLGNWFFVLIALGFTLLLPITLTLGGKLDYGTIFAEYLGAIFLTGGLVAVGIFSSTLTKNQTVAFIISLFATFAFIATGLEVVTMGLPYPLNDIVGELSILRHFDYISKGVIDLRDIFYFLALMFIFLSLTYLIFMARKLNRSAKKYKSLQTGIALMIAIAIVVNLFGAFISFRMDFTGQKLYSLSKGTITVLRDLDDVLTMKLYASKELPPEVSPLYRNIKDTLQDYKNASGGKVQIIQKFPDEDEKAATEAQSQGIQPIQFNVERTNEYQVKQGYLGLSINYGDKKEAIPFMGNTSDLEYQLTSLVRKVSTDKQLSIVFTKGHGEKDLQQDAQELNQFLSKQYKVDSGDKKDLAKKLKSADVAIIAGPKQKFSQAEKDALKDFIDGGKSAFFLLDTVDINMQYFMANPNKDSMADFVGQYGVKVNSDLVYDLKAGEQITLPSGGGQAYVMQYPFWPKLTTNPDHIITNRYKQFVLPWASSIDIDNSKLGEAKAEALFQTSQYANHQTQNFNVNPDPKANVLDQKNLKSYALGYAIKNLGDSGRGHLIVVGDSDFLGKDLGFMQRYQEASGFLLNSIDWLSQDELLINIRSKNAQPSALMFNSDAVKLFVHYFNMVGLVVIIIAFGLWRMNRRRKLPKGYVA